MRKLKHLPQAALGRKGLEMRFEMNRRRCVQSYCNGLARVRVVFYKVVISWPGQAYGTMQRSNVERSFTPQLLSRGRSVIGAPSL